jgi:DNA-binding LytR/AlgR family response regulator
MGLNVLAVDDVPAALDELCRLLNEAPEIDSVAGAADPLTALRMIQSGRFGAVFLDISMPGLDGLELASLLRKLSDPPAIVFVTAHEEHAVAAFGIGAVDYLLKPLRAERLADTLARVARHILPAPRPDAMAALPVETAGRTHYVRRSDVHFVEAHGDYVRLYTEGGSHLVRMPISRLQEYWESSGFVRVHRGFLLALGSVRELRSDSAGGLLAHTDVGDVPVSRRHSRELRERLLSAAQRGELDRRS